MRRLGRRRRRLRGRMLWSAVVEEQKMPNIIIKEEELKEEDLKDEEVINVELNKKI